MEQTFSIPEGCKKVTFKQEGDKIITIFEPEFKKGDIITHKDGAIIIYTGKYNYGINPYGDYCENIVCQIPGEWIFSNEEDTEKLHLVFKEHGKQWNPETMEIEDSKVEKFVKCTTVSGDIIYGNIKKVKGSVIYFIKALCKNVIDADKILSLGDCSTISIFPKDEFQSELNALGFKYNFEDDTISELKWKPKWGESYFTPDFTAGDLRCEEFIWEDDNIDINRYSDGFCFKTGKECIEAIFKIKKSIS